MLLFVEVARTSSFSRASSNLGVPGTTLSRRIAAMERAFGVRLFDRTTWRVALTEAGRRYFERCGHLVDEARLAQEALRDTAEQPSGHVRLSMPVGLGVTVIGPLLSDFARQFPAISFDLDLSPRNTDLVGERVDVAIRLGAVDNGQLVARRIGSVDQLLFASPLTWLCAAAPPSRLTWPGMRASCAAARSSRRCGGCCETLTMTRWRCWRVGVSWSTTWA